MPADATQRVALIFTLLDVNGNGVLDAGDFSLMGSRTVASVPEAAPEAKQALLNSFERYWATLRDALDADGDGVISLEEYSACVLSPERFADTIAEFAEALAGLGDMDGTGFVDRPVFVALMEAIGFERANIDALFDAFEPTAEDRIAAATWVESIKDYYAPDKTGIPGDHLVAGVAA